MGLLLGCIGDDFTGSTDLANTLVRGGMRTVQLIGVPRQEMDLENVDAAVIALKSRSIPVQQAIEQSLGALDWLQRQGAQQFFFKYCSTFDSTEHGNIGPVAQALLERLGESFTIACPAFPETERSVYQGHLFVGDRLLSESGMENHPLTPMTDPDVVRVLQKQVQGKVGLSPLSKVRLGPQALAEHWDTLAQSGHRFAVVDAIEDRDLITIGAAARSLRLVTGGSGVARGLPENFRAEGQLDARAKVGALPEVSGRAAVVVGSCSRATLEQVAVMKRERPGFKLDLLAYAHGVDIVSDALNQAESHLEKGPVLFYTSDTPEAVRGLQQALGRDRAGALGERALSELSTRLVHDSGVRRLVVAGGETSGAVVAALGVQGLLIGDQIDPGVPWTATLGAPVIALALKSGNFGGPDFFCRAFNALRS